MPEIEAELARQAASRGEQVEEYAANLLTGAIHLPVAGADYTRCASGLDWSQCPAVESVAGKVSGAWVFRDTRMPVAAVFENLEDGVTIDELVELYAGLTREQIAAVLYFSHLAAGCGARTLECSCTTLFSKLRKIFSEPRLEGAVRHSSVAALHCGAGDLVACQRGVSACIHPRLCPHGAGREHSCVPCRDSSRHPSRHPGPAHPLFW